MMRRLRSWSSGVALLSLTTTTAPGLAGDAPSGFDFCAPPLRPACIEAPSSIEDCENEVQAFTATVFKYRACLERQTERAVRNANEALQDWKCRTGKLKCRP
jgi:hypothetical protein